MKTFHLDAGQTLFFIETLNSDGFNEGWDLFHEFDEDPEMEADDCVDMLRDFRAEYPDKQFRLVKASVEVLTY